MNNKGMSIVYVSFIMFAILGFLLVIANMGTNDMILARKINDKSKAYYIAEGGIYYGGSLILEAVQSATTPVSPVVIDKPFSEYNKAHSLDITITPISSSYKVVSKGRYNNSIQKVEALVTIDGVEIVTSHMRKIN